MLRTPAPCLRSWVVPVKAPTRSVFATTLIIWADEPATANMPLPRSRLLVLVKVMVPPARSPMPSVPFGLAESARAAPEPLSMVVPVRMVKKPEPIAAALLMESEPVVRSVGPV